MVLTYPLSGRVACTITDVQHRLTVARFTLMVRQVLSGSISDHQPIRFYRGVTPLIGVGPVKAVHAFGLARKRKRGASSA